MVTCLFVQMMGKLMSDMNQPQFQATLDATMRELSGGGAGTSWPRGVWRGGDATYNAETEQHRVLPVC